LGDAADVTTSTDHRATRFQPLSPTATAGEANLAMLADHATVAVVVADGVPVGVITRADLTRHLEDPTIPIGRLLTHVCVEVDPAATPEETLRRFRRAAWEWLLHQGHPPSGDAPPPTGPP
jgi:CBS domain-containing protein